MSRKGKNASHRGSARPKGGGKQAVAPKGRTAGGTERAVWAARAVFWGVAGGLAVVPLSMSVWGSNPFGPPKVFALSLSAALVAGGLLADTSLASRLLGRVRQARGAWALGVLLSLGALSTLTSWAPLPSLTGTYPSYQGFLAMLMYAVIACGAVVVCSDREGFGRLARVVTTALLVVTVYAVLQALGADPIALVKTKLFERVKSTLGNSSNLGVWLAIALPFAFERARRDASRIWRYTAWVAVAATLPTLVWTTSRGALFAVLGAGVLWLALESATWGNRRRWTVFGATAGALVALAVAVAVSSPTMVTRVTSAFDLEGGTAHWRVSAWRSAATMTAARPLLGFGPNSFRWAFPIYREKGQYDGSAGLQVAEDPHNIFASTAVALGLPGLLALLAVLGLAGASVWKARPRAPGDDLGPLAAGAALAGGLIALQFHYVTPDTGPLLWSTLLLASTGLVTERPTAPSVVGEARRVPRAGVVGVAALAAATALTALAAAGLVLADAQVVLGYRQVSKGTAWPVARATFQRAAALAPWETAILRAEARASVRALRGADPTRALSDGFAASTSLVTRAPWDWSALSEQGDLLLSAGIRLRQRSYLTQATGVYRRVIAYDPNNGLSYVGYGTALAGLGQLDAAIATYRTAVELAPNSKTAWKELAAAYKAAGRPADAQKAKRHRLP